MFSSIVERFPDDRDLGPGQFGSTDYVADTVSLSPYVLE
jgi:hypothetical protein